MNEVQNKWILCEKAEFRKPELCEDASCRQTFSGNQKIRVEISVAATLATTN